MNVDIKSLPNSEKELTIKVSYDVYAKWEKKALEEVGKKVKIKGFRPGHIPESVLRENVDPEIIKMTTLDYVLPQTYADAVQKNDLNVIARPKVDIKSEPQKEGDDFVYVATVAVMPEVKLGDYKKIKVALKPAKVTKESIENTIQMISDRNAEWSDVDRKAKMGDRVEIGFEGFDEKDQPIPNTASKNHPVILGSKTMVPGFEEAIVGLKKDEEKEFKVTFPKDYHADSMKNKKVKFKVKLNRLEEKKDQKIDDAWVEKITGNKQSLGDFKKMIEEDLKKDLEAQNKNAFENEVVEAIIKVTKVEIPNALVEQEIDMMIDEQKQRLKQQKVEWDQFLKHIKKTEEDFRKDHQESATKRVKSRLGMQQVIKDAKLEVTSEDIDKEINKIIEMYPKEQAKDIRAHYEKDDQAMNFLNNKLLSEKLFNLFQK